MILFFIEIISMNLFSFGKSFLNIDNSYPSVYILEYDMESVSVIYFILRLSGKVWCVSKIQTIKTIFDWYCHSLTSRIASEPHTSHLSAADERRGVSSFTDWLWCLYLKVTEMLLLQSQQIIIISLLSNLNKTQKIQLKDKLCLFACSSWQLLF